ncbi:MAG: ERAP1-like C-terminal domain-containing protein, partial [Nocardioidaceae bacterium]|nr:ERAP1-like C-terminal domain-containing protein [Nocardioidaceae bacterium]
VIDHLTTHSYGNATLADLLAAWEKSSGKDVRGWAEAWLRTSGVDVLTGEVRDGSVVIERANGSTVDVARPHAFTVTSFDAAGAGRSEPVVITEATAEVALEVDPDGLLLPDSADETWAKIRMDDASLSRVPQLLPKIDDPLARAAVWGVLREGLHDATIAPELYLRAVERALPHDTDLAVENILGGPRKGVIGAVGTFFSATDDRARLAAVATNLVETAPPASNRQLIAVRSLIELTTDPELLRGWLSGETTPEGVVADENFRWRLTRALSALGELGLDDIAAEAQRDPSSQGALHSLQCRSVLPDARTKEAVWSQIVSDTELSNYELYALATYFFRPDQREVTEPYVSRYFTDIPGTDRIRTGWVVEQTAALSYPRYSVGADTVTLAEQALARDDLSPGVRRSMSDSTDDLRWALASRAAHAPH